MTADFIPFAERRQARRVEQERTRTARELTLMELRRLPPKVELAQQRLELSARL